jgi:hypothetical protein
LLTNAIGRRFALRPPQGRAVQACARSATGGASDTPRGLRERALSFGRSSTTSELLGFAAGAVVLLAAVLA